MQLVERSLLGRLVHPLHRGEVGFERLLDVDDHLLGHCLALGADGGGDEGATQGFAQRAVRHLHTTLPAGEEHLLAGERPVVAEAVVHEPGAERVRRPLDRAPLQIDAHVVEVPAREQSVDRAEEVGNGDVDRLDIRRSKPERVYFGDKRAPSAGAA